MPRHSFRVHSRLAAHPEMLAILLAALDGWLEATSITYANYDKPTQARIDIAVPRSVWQRYLLDAQAVVRDEALAIDLVSPNAPVEDPARATESAIPAGRLARITTVGDT